MFLIIAGSAGFLAALFIHWFTWTMRLKHPSVSLVLGALGALGLTWFCLLFLNSDIANMMRIILVIFWAVALLLGGLQAFALKAPWWKSLLFVFFEMAVTFLSGAAVNLTMQSYIAWLNDRFPGVDIYSIINSFLWAMIITLLALAVVRPLILLGKSHEGQSG